MTSLAFLIRRALLVCGAPFALTVSPIAADAVNLTFTGSGASGVDPLGGGWTAGPNVFGFATFTEPLVDNEFPAFNTAGVSNGLGTFATSFTFTYTGSDANPLNQDFDTGFTHVASPEGTIWDTTFLSPESVRFTAPVGEQLDPGETFSLLVGFLKPVKPAKFSFTATWADGSDAAAAVPEPATWAMLIAGFGLTGAALRRARVSHPILAA